MLSNLKNIFKVPDLRNKILFTVMMVVLYRIGAQAWRVGMLFNSELHLQQLLELHL